MTSSTGAITTYRQFLRAEPPRKRLRAALRDVAVGTLSLGRTVPATGSWIRFPYYHHVFEDEREGFTAHLRFMRNHGEFIGIDGAIDMLASEEPIDGRFFCISFDDGLRNCLTNALPILSALQAPAALFIATDYVGASPQTTPELCRRFFDGRPVMLDFLTWDDCREMVEAGMTLGSHTASHAHLIDCTREQVEQEMRRSKAAIEEQLGRTCDHFCCPNGQPGVDFLVERDPALAEAAGYRSFLTTRRGSVHRRPSPYLLERDKMIAAWGVYQLRYFFSR